MRFFVYFFERYLTFCKEGLSLTGGCGEVPEFSPRVQVVCVWVLVVCCHPKACTVQVPVDRRKDVCTVRFL